MFSFFLSNGLILHVQLASHPVNPLRPPSGQFKHAWLPFKEYLFLGQGIGITLKKKQ